MPLYVRAGAIIATGPAKQNTTEVSDQPLRLTIYPGQDGATTLYEDDGISLAHQRGDWQAFRLTWEERAGKFRIALAAGSRAMTGPRSFIVALHNGGQTTTMTFNGDPVEVDL